MYNWPLIRPLTKYLESKKFTFKRIYKEWLGYIAMKDEKNQIRYESKHLNSNLSVKSQGC